MVLCRRSVPGQVFKDNVGDDVLIGNRRLSAVYHSLLDGLGLTISVSKSLMSKTGAVEFAKRFLIKVLTVDFSPISVRCLANYYHPHCLCAIEMKYPMKEILLVFSVLSEKLRITTP